MGRGRWQPSMTERRPRPKVDLPMDATNLEVPAPGASPAEVDASPVAAAIKPPLAAALDGVRCHSEPTRRAALPNARDDRGAATRAGGGGGHQGAGHHQDHGVRLRERGSAAARRRRGRDRLRHRAAPGRRGDREGGLREHGGPRASLA